MTNTSSFFLDKIKELNKDSQNFLTGISQRNLGTIQTLHYIDFNLFDPIHPSTLTIVILRIKLIFGQKINFKN